MLIVGAVIGMMLVPRSGRPGARHAGLLNFAHTLPRERADVIRQTIADGKASLKAARKGIREARTETRAALDDRNFQQAELNRALDGRCGPR